MTSTQSAPWCCGPPFVRGAQRCAPRAKSRALCHCRPRTLPEPRRGAATQRRARSTALPRGLRSTHGACGAVCARRQPTFFSIGTFRERRRASCDTGARRARARCASIAPHALHVATQRPAPALVLCRVAVSSLGVASRHAWRAYSLASRCEQRAASSAAYRARLRAPRASSARVISSLMH